MNWAKRHDRMKNDTYVRHVCVSQKKVKEMSHALMRQNEFFARPRDGPSLWSAHVSMLNTGLGLGPNLGPSSENADTDMSDAECEEEFEEDKDFGPAATDRHPQRTRNFWVEPGQKCNTDTLLAVLMRLRESMIAEGVVYEPDYWIVRDAGDSNADGCFDENDSRHMKLYLLNIGHPGEKHDIPIKEKCLTAFVGRSKTAIIKRLRVKNDPAAVSDNPRTRSGVSRWIIVMILFLPVAWRESTDLMYSYWEVAHGIGGKLKRGIELARMFNLRYYVPLGIREYAARKLQESKIQSPPYEGDCSGPFRPVAGQ